MDASETLEYVRRLNSFEVKCETGRRYTLVLPDMQRLIAYGDVPLSVVGEASKMEDERPDAEAIAKALEGDNRSAMQAMIEIYDKMLADAIVEIDGEEVTMTPEAVRFISPDEREELLEYLRREKDPTTAGVP